MSLSKISKVDAASGMVEAAKKYGKDLTVIATGPLVKILVNFI